MKISYEKIKHSTPKELQTIIKPYLDKVREEYSYTTIDKTTLEKIIEISIKDSQKEVNKENYQTFSIN